LSAGEFRRFAKADPCPVTETLSILFTRTFEDLFLRRGDARHKFDAHERCVTEQIAELRAAGDEADNRVHLALNAVPDTVEKVADRVVRIEADLGEAPPSRDSFLPKFAARRAPRLQRDPQDSAAAVDWRQVDAPGAGPPRPDLVKAKDTPSPGHSGHDASQPANQDAERVRSRRDLDDFLIEPGHGFQRRRGSRTRRRSEIKARRAPEKAWNALLATRPPSSMSIGKRFCWASPRYASCSAPTPWPETTA
jgi:hypothetical protein